MKKLLRYGRVVPIDALVYRMTRIAAPDLADLPYEVSQTPGSQKTGFTIYDQGKFVHQSFLYDRVRLLKLLGKRGPAIGNCVTDAAYRGQSIYPKMIRRIATEQLRKGKSEVFIIVNADNAASIRGIEKAGFELYAAVKASRFLLFYFDKQIKRFT